MRSVPLDSRLLAGIEPEPNSGCWLWFRSIDGKGYGLIGVGGRNGGITRTHRAAWMCWRGPIPTGLKVLHRCDTPPCINPDHLFLGTDADNVADMLAKGRGYKRHGIRNPAAKLTEDQVEEIRRRLAYGEAQHRIGTHFGVSQPTIGRIKRGLSWGVGTGNAR